MRLGTYYRTSLLRNLGLHQVSGRVLDIGGFDGFWASQLTDVEAYVVDLDVEPDDGPATFVRGSGLSLPFRDDVFDHVFALDVLEHVDDERALVDEALRVVRPGGRLVMTTPNDRFRVFPAPLQPWVDRRWGHHRVRGFSANHLEGIIDRGAASLVRVRPLAITAFRYGYFPLTLAWRAAEPLGQRLVTAAALWDARRLRGDHGYMLVEVTR